jgi:4-hydroxyphenylpyruvate dioxygenase-like putative hemolysin
MPHYRLYVLDAHGATIGAVDLEAADDEAAREQAKIVLGDNHQGELWRQVPIIEGNGETR